jgi:hypothetical protein
MERNASFRTNSKHANEITLSISGLIVVQKRKDVEPANPVQHLPFEFFSITDNKFGECCFQIVH